MRHYNGIQGFQALKACVLLAAAGVFGCAQQPAQKSTYSLDVPAAEAPPQEASAPTPVQPAPAQPRMREDVPLRYVVKKGDTLWGIASHFLLDPWQWPEIWYGNEQVKNPHLIYPGNVLSLIYVDGRPSLVNGEVNTTLDAYDGEVVKLSPALREGDLERAIPAIPIDAIRDFLTSSRAVTPEEMAKAPYIVAFLDPQIIAGAGSEAYVKNYQPGESGTYSIVRMGDPFRDPETGELLGYEALPVGTAEVSDTSHKLITVKLTRTVREVRAGDRLLPLEKDVFDAYFYPKAPSKKIDARIIAVLDGVSQLTQYQVVTLNRGSDAGLERGDVLTILAAGRVTRDPVTASSTKQVVLPDLEAGSLMVFKLMPKISHALIMRGTRPIHRLDKAVNPTNP